MIVEHKNINSHCMSFYVEQLGPRYLKIHIASLRYELPRTCNVSGRILLEWLLEFAKEARSPVRHITLTDASTAKIPGVARPIFLPLWRKFIKGKNWYEQFGFQPKDMHTHWSYHETFKRLRNASTDDVKVLLWLHIQLVLVSKSTRPHELRRAHENEDVDVKIMSDTSFKTMVTKVLRERFGMQSVTEGKRGVFDSVRTSVRYLEKFIALNGGMQPEIAKRYSFLDQTKTSDYCLRKLKFDDTWSPTCLLNTAYRGATSYDMSNVSDQITPLYFVLRLLWKLDILKVPGSWDSERTNFSAGTMVWQKRSLATPSAVTKECRRPSPRSRRR